MRDEEEARAPPLNCVTVLTERMLGGSQVEMKEAPGGRVAEKKLTVMIAASATTAAMNVATNAVTTWKSELLPEVRKKVRRLLIH